MGELDLRFERWVMASVLTGAIWLGGCDPQRRETLKTDEISVWLKRLPQGAVLQLAGGDTVHVSPVTTSFYRRRLWRAAWAGEKDLLERGWQVHQSIGKANEDGLNPAQYGHEAAARLLQKLEAQGEGALPDSLRASYLASVDVLLTEGFNRYANDLVTGTIDPSKSGIDWRIAPGKANEERVLAGIIKGLKPSQVVAHLRPSIPQYDRMRTSLIRFQEVAARGGWPNVPEGSYKAGGRAPGVSVLRTRLIAGLDPTEAALAQKGAADPTLFDADLQKAVEHFQGRHGIESDGGIGATTLRELNHAVEERIEELKLNLDRWRWLPDNLGERYLMVNIAGFEMEVVDKGRVVEHMNVVVGQTSWKTPVFADTMEHVVLNPYWNVPPSIYKAEILPHIEADPNWLASNNYERTNDGGVRQRPGPDNALGQYKFVFPNKDDIYLHDTPSGHLFSRVRRDFSHGCIRLERPEDLANLIVRLQTNRDPSTLASLAASGAERWIKLDRPLPVYILYFTAWVEEDGTVRFHHDVYGRDEQLAPQSRKLSAG
jgi:L,D-transpeptidase YcbB